MLEGFERLSIETTGATINVLRSGSGSRYYSFMAGRRH